MKKILILIAVLLSSITAFAGEIVKEEAQDSYLSVLDSVLGVKSTYSKSSGLEAKVIELLGGDGMNPTRMVLVIGDGQMENGSGVYELDAMMYEVERITFSDIDTIVINYTQDSFDDLDEMNQIKLKRSMQVKVLRDSTGQLNGKIEIENLK